MNLTKKYFYWSGKNFHNWVDEQYREHNQDPEATAAAEALRRELESLTDTNARKSWERLADLLTRHSPK